MCWTVTTGVTSCDQQCIVTCWGRQAGNKYVWQVGKASKALNMWKARKAVNISGRQTKRQGKAGLALGWYDLPIFCAVNACVTTCDQLCIVMCWVRQAGNKYVHQIGKAVNM